MNLKVCGLSKDRSLLLGEFHMIVLDINTKFDVSEHDITFKKGTSTKDYEFKVEFVRVVGTNKDYSEHAAKVNNLEEPAKYNGKKIIENSDVIRTIWINRAFQGVNEDKNSSLSDLRLKVGQNTDGNIAHVRYFIEKYKEIIDQDPKNIEVWYKGKVIRAKEGDDASYTYFLALDSNEDIDNNFRIESKKIGA